MTQSATISSAKISPAPTGALVITRYFDAPPALVFRAFIDPVHFVRWFGPLGCTVPHCRIDPLVGGQWRACIHTPEGKDHWVGGHFRRIDLPDSLVFTWRFDESPGNPTTETIVTIAMKARGNGTDFTLRQEGFVAAEAEIAHERGWSSSLDKLPALLREML